MLKALALIGMMFTGSLFAAAALPNDLDTQLENTHTRATNAATFETMAAQSVYAVDDGARVTLNTSLTQSFEQMEKALGVSPLLSLHTIETEVKATEACAYYRGAVITLAEQLDEQNVEAE